MTTYLPTAERSSESVPMASFGENLRREREMRGVTLQEISAATKISVRFLHALEAEEFAKLPGGIFTRSFIRAYARYLGLDEEPVLAEYQLVAQPKGDVDLTRLTVGRPLSPREGSRAPLLALVVAAAMLAGGYALFRYSRRAAETEANTIRVSAPPSAAASQPQEGSTAAPAAPAAQSSTAPGPGGQSVSTSPPGQAGPALAGIKGAETEAGLTLQVAATERAWLAVDADGKTTFQGVLSPNEIQTVKAKESFDVTTGNAQGIILTLNGETLKPLGRRGEVKSIHLTHQDLKNPVP